MKKLLSLLTALSMSFIMVGTVYAQAPETADRTFTFNWSQSSTSTFSLENNIADFFIKNQLDYSYYMNWIGSLETANLQTITFTIGEEEMSPQTRSNSAIQGDRIVYVDRVYSHSPKTNQFAIGTLMANAVSEVITLYISKYSKVLSSLASIFGITNPSSYFGSNRVRQNSEYYINDGANRVVTKFVELYAPVSGTIKWYPWGFAESDYVRHGVQLYYKGLESGSKANVYTQYYTQNYYNISTLTNCVKDAYPSRNYNEFADEYAASNGGYSLFTRDINATIYLEYDNLVNN